MIKYTLLAASVIILTVCLLFLFCAKSSRVDLENIDFRNATQITRSIKSSREVKQRLPVKCGQRLDAYSSRIVGGRSTTIEDFPWMISLQREKNFWFGYKRFYHSCGGSLITPSWILTASHCVSNRDESLRAVAGTDNLSYLYRAQLRTISQIIMHPKFDIETYNNDIALLKVNEPFDIGSKFSRVGTICVESGIPVLPYDIATICGFGASKFHNKARTHLYETDIAIIDQTTCNKSFGGAISKDMVCAGGMIANKRDACSGDSGGPLQMDIGQHVTLIGIVSFGNSCAMNGFPGIYTKVGNYYDWIVKTIDENLPRF